MILTKANTLKHDKAFYLTLLDKKHRPKKIDQKLQGRRYIYLVLDQSRQALLGKAVLVHASPHWKGVLLHSCFIIICLFFTKKQE